MSSLLKFNPNYKLWLGCLILLFINYFISGISIILTAIVNLSIIIPLILYKVTDKYKPKLKIYIINLAVFLISVFVLLIFAELFLHIAKPGFLQLKWSITGDFNDFSARGFLNKTVFHKKAGVFRILGIGDSFAVNLRHLGKNYHNILNNKLADVYGPTKVEVINTGIAATGPGYYWNTLSEYGDLIKPDLVLVGFFLGNDFFELKFNKINIGLFIREPRDLQKRLWGYLRLKNFWLYQFITKKTTIMADFRKRDKEVKAGKVKHRGSFSKAKFLTIEKARLWFFEKHNRKALIKVWNRDSEVILNFKKWCDQRNLELVVAIFPDQLQVEPGLLKEILTTYNIPPDNVDLEYPNILLANYFKQHNIHYVDLLKQFQNKAKTKKLYLYRDTHWNEAGNELAANIIFDYLEKNMLVRSD